MNEIIRNQYDEEIHTKSMHQRNGIWEHHTLNCYSSSDLGLGTCRCVSHDVWDVRPATLDELTEEGIILLSEERFNQLLAIVGVTLGDLEEFCGLSYRLDSNPLPKIRAILPGFRVGFMHNDSDRRTSWAHDPADGPEVVVELWDDRDRSGSLCVQIETYFD